MKKRLIALLLALALTFTLVACGGGGAPAEDGEILIGSLNDITGPTSTFGLQVDLGVRWAVDAINANGGVNGRQIRVITYDTAGDVSEAVNAFTRAVTMDNVVAVVGPPISNIALAVAPISEQFDVPLLGFALDSRAHIREDGTPFRNMFGMQPNADAQGAAMARFALQEGYRNFGIIFNEGNAYSVSLRDPFVAVIEAGGGTIVEEVTYTWGVTEFRTLLDRLIAADVEAIFAPNFTQEIILIYQQARALGYEGRLIFGLDACPPFQHLLGEAPENVFFLNNVNVNDPDSDLRVFMDEIYEELGIIATEKFFIGYDVANILAMIFETTTDPDEIREAVRGLTNYQGRSGVLTIDPSRHELVGYELHLFTYVGMEPVLLYTFRS